MDFGSSRLRIVSTPAPRLEGLVDQPRQHPARAVPCTAWTAACGDQSFDAYA
jgi:hypothetical protein